MTVKKVPVGNRIRIALVHHKSNNNLETISIDVGLPYKKLLSFANGINELTGAEYETLKNKIDDHLEGIEYLKDSVDYL